MNTSGLNRSRLIVGVVLIVAAVGLFVFGEGGFSSAGAIGLGVLGLVSIAISRRK